MSPFATVAQACYHFARLAEKGLRAQGFDTPVTISPRHIATGWRIEVRTNAGVVLERDAQPDTVELVLRTLLGELMAEYRKPRRRLSLMPSQVTSEATV